jgi:hypothetical protein
VVDASHLLRGALAGGVIGLLAWRRISLLSGVGAALGAALLGDLAIESSGGSISVSGVLVGVAASGVVSATVQLLARRGRERMATLGLLLVVQLGFLWVAGVLPGIYRQAVPALHAKLVEPIPEQYDFDGRIYLKTYYLMERGEPYYRAFATAYTEDARYAHPPEAKLNYREPLLFEIWRWLPGRTGGSLHTWFLALVAVVMALGYRLARQFVGPGTALLAPIVLSGYFMAAAWSTTWFLFPEFWAGGVAVAAALAFVRARWLTTALLIGLAVALRELMIYLVPAFVVGWMLHPKRRGPWPALAVGVILPLVALAAHWIAAPGRPAEATNDLAPWLHGGLAPLKAALEFSNGFVVTAPSAFLWAPVAALVGSALVRPWWRAGFLLAALGFALIGLTAFSGGAFGYYWGAALQPLVLALAPVAALRLDPAEGVEPGV